MGLATSARECVVHVREADAHAQGVEWAARTGLCKAWYNASLSSTRCSALGGGNCSGAAGQCSAAERTQAAKATLATLVQNNFSSKGDVTLSTSTTYDFTIAGGYKCSLEAGLLKTRPTPPHFC